MSTCNRLYYVSKVCLRLLRKYTNEIYPNDVSKLDKFHLKKRLTETDDKNDIQICKSIFRKLLPKHLILT